MAETLTSIQIRPTTRDQLRRVKAETAQASGKAVDYDDMVQALLRHWASQPTQDLQEVLAVEAQHGR